MESSSDTGQPSFGKDGRPSIGIIGLGWLGFPLALHLRAKDMTVWGTTTRPERLDTIRRQGIDAETWVLNPDSHWQHIEERVSSSTCLVLNIPPGMRKSGTGDYTERVARFLELGESLPLQDLIYISTTSVFGSGQGVVDEYALPVPDSPGGWALLEAEGLIRLARPQATIIRPGGLLGGERHPVYSLSGRTALAGGSQPVNLVQREDLVELISHLLIHGYRGDTLHAVYPDHPPKAEYYRNEAEFRGLPLPAYSPDTPPGTGKLVRSILPEKRGFVYRHPIRSSL